MVQNVTKMDITAYLTLKYGCDKIKMEVKRMNKRIVCNPKICGGEPCIKGTRIPVRVILSHIAAGEDYSSILKQFPRIKKEDILACLDYASYLATEKAVI